MQNQIILSRMIFSIIFSLVSSATAMQIHDVMISETQGYNIVSTEKINELQRLSLPHHAGPYETVKQINLQMKTTTNLKAEILYSHNMSAEQIYNRIKQEIDAGKPMIVFCGSFTKLLVIGYKGHDSNNADLLLIARPESTSSFHSMSIINLRAAMMNIKPSLPTTQLKYCGYDQRPEYLLAMQHREQLGVYNFIVFGDEQRL